MITLTRVDLIDEIYNFIGLSKREAKDLVDCFFEELLSALANGENVKVSGFGNFVLRDKSVRIGRNPKTGKTYPIPSRRVVTFRPGQKLKLQMESYGSTKKTKKSKDS